MSRVGKNPVAIPAGVTIELKGQHLKAKGKRGEAGERGAYARRDLGFVVLGVRTQRRRGLLLILILILTLP